MRTIIVRCGRALSILLCVSCLFLAGCGAKEEGAGTHTQPTPAQRQSRPTGKVQAALDELRSFPAEPDPAKRPLVLSRRAADRKTWILQVLEQGYTQTAHADPKWDPAVNAAFDAYADYSRAQAYDQFTNLVRAVTEAVAAGCNDPMLQYMQVRYKLAEQSSDQEEVALSYLKAFRALAESRYHPVLKFMAGYRAAVAARDAQTNCDRAPLLALTLFSLQDLARDTNAPVQEVFEPASWWVDYGHGKGWLEKTFADLKPILEKNWRSEAAFDELCGAGEVGLAWVERGGGFANSVTEKGWSGFKRHLDQAESYLTAAWQKNPSNAHTAYLMMQLELGQGQGRQRMELWFKRAMALSTNYYDAAKLMSFYLEPRWYGSEESALEFARSCVTSTNWGGTVPLVLPDVHHSLARYTQHTESPQYWHRPEVWDDIKSAYDKFYKLCPDGVGYRHNYALDAFLCGHYAEFLVQTKLFSTGTNYSYFGGQARFKQMLARAAAAKAG